MSEVMETILTKKQKPVISTKEARKLLGKKWLIASDEQVIKLIKELDSISKAYIETTLKEKDVNSVNL